MDFSLFYFAGDGSADTGRYRLLLEGAKFADTHGFTAVWSPERHFNALGGPYPNPAVTGAALAMVTERVAIRAGSVVAPLHHPLRIAEEWAMVDNLSGGRVGLALASGWHAVDFVLRPETYARRRSAVVETLEMLRKLWRGDGVELPGATGAPAEVKVYPTPVQPEIPVWLTSFSSPETFRQAGELGAGVLTNLLGQDLDELASKIAIYRQAFRARDGMERGPHVVLMLHTFLGPDRTEVRETVREPFSDFLRSAIGMLTRSSSEVLPDLKPEAISPEDVEFLVRRFFDRYFETRGLFGTIEDGLRMVTQLTEIGVDEVACFIDFVGHVDTVLDGLEYLDKLRAAAELGVPRHVQEVAASASTN